MDTVVKSMLEESDEEKPGLVIFGRDVSKIPCFRESFLYGITSGVGIGLAAFIKTSKPMLSQHIGFGAFMMSTLVYWSYCRYDWSRQKFNAQLLQDALKDKMMYEGTVIEKEMEQIKVLKPEDEKDKLLLNKTVEKFEKELEQIGHLKTV